SHPPLHPTPEALPAPGAPGRLGEQILCYQDPPGPANLFPSDVGSGMIPDRVAGRKLNLRRLTLKDFQFGDRFPIAPFCRRMQSAKDHRKAPCRLGVRFPKPVAYLAAPRESDIPVQAAEDLVGKSLTPGIPQDVPIGVGK